jgi:hypothetical protein
MIYDEAHLINANVLDGAIRGAAARYEHCQRRGSQATPHFAMIATHHFQQNNTGELAC